ncbi:hypothetical protein [Polyangium mundeleinium]|uniref:Uncharacterized protein n=1 Tax=Polyangium mundeleinium TaxID=2995306 RepID=A0ABT5EU20_9BACT|nr:hypothetical protein [Polyangium mundeleinium]MDC0745324.1 hypothetical protein [Polyangium mundeleinium]
MRAIRPLRIVPWRSGRRPVGSALLGVALALRTGLALGEEPKSAGPAVDDAAAQPVLVLLVAKGVRSPLEERAVTLVAAHVRSAGVTLKQVERPASSSATGDRIADARAVANDEGTKGVLWVEIGPQDELVLHLLEKEGGRVFRRGVPAPAGQTSAALEALANIAGSAAAELVIEGHIVTMTSLESADAGSSPAPAAEAVPVSAPPPAPPPPETRAPAPVPAPRVTPPPEAPAQPSFRRLLLSAGYTGGTFASEASWQSALALSAWWAPAPNARVGLGYEMLFEEYIKGSSSPLDVDLSRHPIVLSGGYRFLFGGRWDVDLGARSTVDIVVRDPHPVPPSAAPSPTPSTPPPLRHAVDTLVSVAPTVGLGFRIVDRLRLGAWAGVDVPLNRLSTTNQRRIDLQIAPVRFLGGLEFQVELIEPTVPRPVRAGR